MTAMNSKIDSTIHERNLLEKAGLATVDVSAWLAARHELRNDFGADSRACSDFWDLGQKLRAQLPKRAARNPNDTAASELIHRNERDLRDRFLGVHTEELYGKVTARRSKFLRLEELIPETARLVPGLTPSSEAMAAEHALPLKEKEGLEIDHGILLSHVLAHPESGHHLCHAMLLPRTEALNLQPRLERDGSVDLGAASVSRVGRASIVELRNPKALNAMDETTLAPLEIAIDLAILDPAPRWQCCAAARWNMQNTPGGGYFPPASISLISIRGKSRSCSTFSM